MDQLCMRRLASALGKCCSYRAYTVLSDRSRTSCTHHTPSLTNFTRLTIFAPCSQLHHPPHRPCRAEKTSSLRVGNLHLHILHPRCHCFLLPRWLHKFRRSARRHRYDLSHLHRLLPLLRARQLGPCVGGLSDEIKEHWDGCGNML